MASDPESLSSPPANLTPDEIELDTIEITMMDETIDELIVLMQKNQQLQMVMQQTQAAFQQNQVEINGLSKAADKLIKMQVRKSGFVGDYVYDKDKKRLVKKKV